LTDNDREYIKDKGIGIDKEELDKVFDRFYRAKDSRVSEIVGTGRSFIAVDSLGAGPNELVVITQGSSSRMTSGTSDAPVDCVIIGIIDSVTVLGKKVYQDQD